jgi:hypothetical protein
MRSSPGLTPDCRGDCFAITRLSVMAGRYCPCENFRRNQWECGFDLESSAVELCSAAQPRLSPRGSGRRELPQPTDMASLGIQSPRGEESNDDF